MTVLSSLHRLRTSTTNSSKALTKTPNMATTTPFSPQGLSYLMLVQDDPCWIWSTQSSEGLGGFCRRCQRSCWPPGGHQPWCPSHGPLCRPQRPGRRQPGSRPAAAAPSEPLLMGRWHLPTVQSVSTQSTCCTNPILKWIQILLKHCLQ